MQRRSAQTEACPWVDLEGRQKLRCRNQAWKTLAPRRATVMITSISTSQVRFASFQFVFRYAWQKYSTHSVHKIYVFLNLYSSTLNHRHSMCTAASHRSRTSVIGCLNPNFLTHTYTHTHHARPLWCSKDSNLQQCCCCCCCCCRWRARQSGPQNRVRPASVMTSCGDVQVACSGCESDVPNLPFPWEPETASKRDVSLESASVFRKWHLNPANSLNRVHKCNRQTDDTRRQADRPRAEKCVAIGGIVYSEAAPINETDYYTVFFL